MTEILGLSIRDFVQLLKTPKKLMFSKRTFKCLNFFYEDCFRFLIFFQWKMIFRNVEGNREFQGRQFYCWRWPIYFYVGFTMILGDNLHCGFSQQHQTGKSQLVISILHACRISISIICSWLPIKMSRGDLRRIYVKIMECSMMSRGFKYFITSVHLAFFTLHASNQ